MLAALLLHLAGMLVAPAAGWAVGSVPGQDPWKLAQRAEETGHIGEIQLAPPTAPTPTSAPQWGDIFARHNKRQAEVDNTCGWAYYNDDPFSDTYPLTCGDNSVCANLGSMRGCCGKGGQCETTALPTVCLDMTDCPAVWPRGTMCCEVERFPYCRTNLWSTDVANTYTYLVCRIDTSSRFGIIQAYESVIATTPTDLNTPITKSSIDADSITTSANNDIVKSGGSNNTGVIVGSVVGGVAFIAIAILVFILLHKRNKVDSPAVPTAPNQPTMGSVPDHLTDSNTMGSAPNQLADNSIMSQHIGMTAGGAISPPPTYDPRVSYLSGMSSPVSPDAQKQQQYSYGPMEGGSPNKTFTSVSNPVPVNVPSPQPCEGLGVPVEAPAENPRGWHGGNNAAELA